MPQTILPNIDYKYWLEKAGENVNNQANGTFQAMITTLKSHAPKSSIIKKYLNDPEQADITMEKLLQKGKELADDLRDTEFKSGKKTLELPAPKSLNEDLNSLIKKNALTLGIFDAIQGWGGQTGRNPYVATDSGYVDGKAPRQSPEYWLKYYKKGIELTKEGKFQEALYEFSRPEMKEVGISFASKHLWFWGMYWKSKGYIRSEKDAHVYDTRIARILFGVGANVDDYNKATEAYDKIIKEYNLDNFSHSSIEQALFAFSNSYFDNNLTKLEATEGKDAEEAKRIFDIRQKEKEENPKDTNNRWKYINKSKKEKAPEGPQELPKSKTLGSPKNGVFYVEKEAVKDYPWVKPYLTNISFTGRNSGKDYWEVKPKKSYELFSKLVNDIQNENFDKLIQWATQ